MPRQIVETRALDVLDRAGRISTGFRRAIEDTCQQEFSFRAKPAMEQGSFNSYYLWWIEFAADRFPEIDLAFRCDIVSLIVETWARRLKGYAPYRSHGYIIVMWKTLAVKISVVSRNALGAGVRDPDAKVTTGLREFLAPLAKQHWRDHFADTDGNWHTFEATLLDAIDKNHGSIGRSTCDRLGMSQVELRRVIENADIVKDVNRIRKRHGRRPAKLIPYRPPRTTEYYEVWLEPGYD